MQLHTVIESPLFTKFWPDYWSMDEHGEFMAFIAGNPDAGDVIPGSGGCRKVRWGAGGKGKRGGLRVIYYWWLGGSQYWLFTLYGKDVQDDLSASQKKALKRLLDAELQARTKS